MAGDDALHHWAMSHILWGLRVVCSGVVVRKSVVIGAEDDVGSHCMIIVDDIVVAGEE